MHVVDACHDTYVHSARIVMQRTAKAKEKERKTTKAKANDDRPGIGVMEFGCG